MKNVREQSAEKVHLTRCMLGDKKTRESERLQRGHVSRRTESCQVLIHKSGRSAAASTAINILY